MAAKATAGTENARPQEAQPAAKVRARRCEAPEGESGPAEPPRARRVIVAELAELIRLHVRPEWQQWCLDGLPKFGQLEMFE